MRRQPVETSVTIFSSCMSQSSADYLMLLSSFGTAFLRPQFRRHKPCTFNIQRNQRCQNSYILAPTSALSTHCSRNNSDLYYHTNEPISRLQQLDHHSGTHSRSEDGGNQELYNENDRNVSSAGRGNSQELTVGQSEPKTQTGPDFVYVSSARIAEAKLRVAASLRREDAHQLIFFLGTACEDPTYLSSLPKTTISEILRLLDPQHLFESVKFLYRYLTPRNIDFLGGEAQQMDEIFKYYKSKVRSITDKLVADGRQLGLQEYKLLLNFARSMGDGDGSVEVWDEMIKHQVKPDTVCYNHYFEARCWEDTYYPTEKTKTRICSLYLNIRRTGHNQPQYGNRSERKDRLGYKVGSGGLKQEVTTKFTEMIARSVRPDGRTYGLLMTAYSREGDLQAVKSILKSVWDVDVDAIMKSEDDFMSPAAIHADSPLHPTSELLCTIAHIFGSNSELAVAMRVVDHISRRFFIAIDRETWRELLEWTFALSKLRSKQARSCGLHVGQLPPSSVERLWKIMTSHPYNIKPTIAMIDRVVRSFSRRHQADQMIHHMRAGLKFHESSQHTYKRLRLSIVRKTWSKGFFNESKHRLQQMTQVSLLRKYRDFLFISRWFRLLLRRRRGYRPEDRILIWERQTLPKAIELFWHYRPLRGISYLTASGKVEIKYDNELQLKVEKGRKYPMSDLPAETDDQDSRSLSRFAQYIRKDEIASRRRQPGVVRRVIRMFQNRAYRDFLSQRRARTPRSLRKRLQTGSQRDSSRSSVP